MTEPTPLSAEEEQGLRDAVANGDPTVAYAVDRFHMVPRFLATLDAARATVPAADDRERLREALDAALWDLEGPNASHPEIRARYRRAVMDALEAFRAGVSPSTGDDR